MGFRVLGLRLDARFAVQAFGCGVGISFRVQGLGFRGIGNS